MQPAGVPQVTADLTHAVWDGSIADADVATIEVRNGQPYGTTDADPKFQTSNSKLQNTTR